MGITRALTGAGDFYALTGIRPYYEADGIVVVVGDCMDVLPHLERVDHVITDPPYSETTHKGARYGGDGKLGSLISFDSIDAGFVRRSFAMAGARRWTVATIDWRHMGPIEQEPPDGLRFVRFGMWNKPDGAPQFTGDRPATGWEAVAILHAVGGRMRWNGGGKRAVWTHNIARGEHPTEKPLPLLKDFIADFTDPGDLILDPFAGSLTTAVAAKHLGRRCIAIEREEKWAEAGVLRLEHGSKGAALVAAGQMPFGEVG